jgi:hypothetical protein
LIGEGYLDIRGHLLSLHLTITYYSVPASDRPDSPASDTR